MRGFLASLFSAVLFLIPPAAIAADVGASPRPPLWRVQNGVSTVYLFGSLHILPPEYVWTTPEIEAAMARSDLFIFEVPVDEEALKEEKAFIIENGFFEGRQSLRGLLSQNEFQLYTSIMRRAGVKRPYYEFYRPWLATVVLGLAYLHGTEIATLSGADDFIKQYASDNGRDYLYLETVRDQMSLLNIGDQKLQLKALKHLLQSLPRSREQQRLLRETWASGDAKAFTALLEGYFEGRPDAKEILINRRNRDWMGRFKEYLARPGTTMVTVGAAHIGGEQGLIGLLCDAGYDVERIGGVAPLGEKECAPEA